LSRIARDTAVVCALLAALSMVVWPGAWRFPLGVVGGAALVGLSSWVIRGTVDGWLGRGGGRPGAALGLVKFFTRYAILGFAAYVMMARLHLDPVGMLAGVSALGTAAGAEAVRSMRAPGVGRRG
jgi:hypothetical protein